MKNLYILLLCLIIGCKGNIDKNESISAKDFLELEKNKEISNFRNWQIYPRKDSGAPYLFDYFSDDEFVSRFFIIENEEEQVLYKQIFPKQDSVFQELGGNIKDTILLTQYIYTEFKSLNVNSLKYMYEYDLFLLNADCFSVIYSENGINSLSNINRFSNYKKFNAHWFYYEKEEE